MKTVLVMLSSYNGEKYIQEQLDSLLKQEDIKCNILIRDDGSNDNTLKILDAYSIHKNIKVLRGKNIGWKKSFFELLYLSSEADYYSFCDQDDIWLPNKLKVAIEALEIFPSDSPNLYGSNLRYFKNGIDMGLVKQRAVQFNTHTALIANLTAGCTMVFNKKLRDMIIEKPPCIEFPHDYWVYLLASLLGNVIYDDNAYILYRQHDNNQIGATISKSIIWKKRIENILDLAHPKGRQAAAKELLRLYGEILPEREKTIVMKIAYYNRSLKERFSLLFDRDFSFYNWDSNLGLKLRILFGGV